MNQTDNPSKTNWAIVIFACRESVETLTRTVSAALIDASNTAVVDILVNGNSELAEKFAARLEQLVQQPRVASVRVWSIPYGDKANAWNQYIHQIWDGQEIAFFVDGYIRLNPDAVTLLGEEVATRTDVLGGTGLPCMGRSGLVLRAHMLKHGGLHGNFCCIKGSAISQLKQRQIALPIGLYRVDSLIGALLNYDLHPERRDWNSKRIFAHPTASWQTDSKHWWRLSDIKAKLKQMLRQSRGILENLAVKDHFVVLKQLPETLPSTATELVQRWVARHPEQVRAMVRRNPFVIGALAHSRKSNEVAAADLMPKLVKNSRQP